jgi:endonuclease/exonuclease/phosphatase family metal-dependent hydrolase
MRKALSALNGRVISGVLFGVVAFVASTSGASAQTTVSLNQPKSQVVYATLRGGTYASKNYPTLLATQASTDLSNARRALLKFDTQNLIPAGANVTSAVLTVTVKSGGSDASRTIAAYQGTTSWTETQTTWTLRRTGQSWTTAGGDMGTELAQKAVSNVAGTKISFDITPLVQQAVTGKLGSSRYTRVELVDAGSSSANSYREFASPDDANGSARPVLKVTYGAATTQTAPPPATGTALKVLQWNTHHGGVGTDGVFDAKRLMQWVAKINPDIVSLNEVERNTSWSKNQDCLALYLSLLKQLTGKTWYGTFVTAAGAATGNGNAILSKTPFVSTAHHQLSYKRAIVEVQIAWNGRIVNFASTHLDADSTSYRMTEISEVQSWFQTFAQQRIICGDFNAWPGSSENANMKTAYNDSWADAQADGTAVAYAGNTAGNTRNSRIDYIYYSKQAGSLDLKSSQVFDTRDSNGVMPSDHRPVLSTFTVN